MLKVSKILVGITFCLLITFFGLTWDSFSLFAQAEETIYDCNLDENISITFLEGKCTERTLEEPEIFYRYYTLNEDGTEKYKYGRYLTTDKFDKSTDVIVKLALDQDWGNKANLIETVTLPVGTTVYQGITGPQNPSDCYPGGGQQTFIVDSRDVNIIWSEGEEIESTEFNCI
ncbi:MAG: hypothetical protein QNJ37_22635, partial [Crocosphaera sp.]|nr:hypothetical protein [Crocosphaera sp.]